MLQIFLGWLGISSGRIDAFTSVDPTIPLGHVFLEVDNPQDLSRQIADADYDIYYTDDQKRLNAFDLIFLQPHQYYLCNSTDCGWSISSGEGFSPALLKGFGYYGVVYRRKESDMYINKSIFDQTVRHEHLEYEAFQEYYTRFKVIASCIHMSCQKALRNHWRMCNPLELS